MNVYELAEFKRLCVTYESTSLSQQIQNKDLAFGLSNECNVLHRLQKYYPDFKPNSLNKYATFDYVCESVKIKVELKTRRIASTTYSTLMIGKNKLEYINSQPNYKGLFLFACTDGLFGIWCNDLELGTNYELDLFRRTRRNHKSDKLKLYIYINTKSLKPFDVLWSDLVS
jgi:hypothetical protein